MEQRRRKRTSAPMGGARLDGGDPGVDTGGVKIEEVSGGEEEEDLEESEEESEELKESPFLSPEARSPSPGPARSEDPEGKTGFILITDPTDYCCGRIHGPGHRFCLVRRALCSYSTHAANRAPVKPNSGYIMVPGKRRQGLLEPSLPREAVKSDQEWMDLLGKAHTVDALKSFVVEKLEGVGGSPDPTRQLGFDTPGLAGSTTPTSTIKEHEDAASGLKSPSAWTMPLDELQALLEESEGLAMWENIKPKGESLEKALSEGADVGDQIKAILEELERQEHNTALVSAAAQGRGEAQDKLTTLLHRLAAQMEVRLKELTRKLQVLHAGIGDQASGRSTIPKGASVWEAVQWLKKELDGVVARAPKGPEVKDALVEVKQMVEASRTAANLGLVALEKKAEGAVRQLDRIVNMLGTAVTENKAVVEKSLARAFGRLEVLERARANAALGGIQPTPGGLGSSVPKGPADAR